MNRSQRANKGPKGNGSSGPSEPGNYWSNLLSFPTSDAYLFQPLVAILIPLRVAAAKKQREIKARRENSGAWLRQWGRGTLATQRKLKYRPTVVARCHPTPSNDLSLSLSASYLFLLGKGRGKEGGGGDRDGAFQQKHGTTKALR